MKRLVIAGGGFAGFWAAAAAARLRGDTGSLASLEILLVSRDDQLVIRPRLYEPDPGSMSVALAPRLHAIGVEFRQGEVTSIDIAGSLLRVTDDSVSYSKLVLAMGSQLARPSGAIGSHGFDTGFDIDTLAGAAKFDRHLQELVTRQNAEGQWTVVIAGGGFTGIELGYVQSDYAYWLDVPRFASSSSIKPIAWGRVWGMDRNHPFRTHWWPRGSRCPGAIIAQVDSTCVTLSTGERIACQTLVWTTGMRASPLAAQVAGQISTQIDSLGRIAVSPELRVTGAGDIFAAGDMACAMADDGYAILQSCQHAQVSGRFAGHNAAADLAGVPLHPYRQPLYTTCLDLGNSGAVLTTGWERTVQATGDKAKDIKRRINTQLIYPPLEREAILAAAAPSVMDEEIFRRRILNEIGNPETSAASRV